MVRWSDTSNRRTRLIGSATALVLALLPVDRATAMQSPSDLPPHAKTPLAAIAPVPEFPEAQPNAQLVQVGELVGADRRDWRDAETRYADGRWRDAAEKLDALIAKHPGFAEGRVLRARCYARTGDATKASADLAAAIGADPRHVAAHELAGETALLAGDKATAIYEFRLALKAGEADVRSSDRVLAVLFLARTIESEGYLAAAADLYAEFLEATSDLTPEMRRNDRLREMVETTGPELNRRIAAIRARLGEETVAVDAWRSVVRDKPDDANAWRELSHALARRGNADEAFESLHRYLALTQMGAGAVVELATLCELLPASADCDARAVAVVRSLGDADLSIQWAKRYVSAKRYGKAAELLGAAAKSHPDRADIRYLLAHVRADEGQPAAAFEELIAGAKLDTEPTASLLSMLRDQRDSFELSGLLREAAAHADAHPDDAMSHLLYATLLSASDQTDAAIEHYLKVTSGTPGYGAALAGLTDACVQKMEWTAALDAASKAIDAGVKTGRVYYLKGLAHDALSQDVSAIEAFETASRCEPPDSRLDAFLGMATIAERKGDRRSAERVYRKILADVDPNCAAACEWLIMFYMDQQRSADAQRIFERFQKPLSVSPALIRCSAMIDLLSAVGQSKETLLSEYLGKLRSILKDHPDDAATYIELATTFKGLGRLDEALVELESAVRVDPRNIKALEMKAEVYARLLDFAAAETVVDRLLRHRPRDLKYIQSKLDFANNRGASDSTIEMLRALNGRDDLKEYHDRFTLQLVEELRAADRSDEAVRVAETWLNDRPDDLFRRNLYLEVLSLAGRHDEAVLRARQYYERAPTDRIAQIQLLASLQSAKRITEAMQLALSLLEKNPSDFDLTSAIIRLCWSARQWDDAIEIARSAIEDTDQPGRYEQLLSLTFQHAGRFDEAIEMRREQVRRFQKLADRAQGAPHETSIALRLRQANYELINAMTAAGRYAEAERLTESLLSPLVDDSAGADLAYVMDLRNILSEIYRRSGQDSQAIEQLEAIYRLAPLDPGAANNLSYTLADTGLDVDRAEQLVRSSLAKDPNSSASLDTLGWVLYKKGEFDEAVYYLRRALRAAQFSDPVILDHLADTLYRLDDNVGADRAWKKALSFCDPEGDPPPSRDRVELHDVIQSKVDALNANETVETAPLAKDGPTSKPAVDSSGADAS